MSVTLVLAIKFNEPLASDEIIVVVKKLLVEIDQVHSIPSRDVLAMEFQIYAQLSFALHVPLADIQVRRRDMCTMLTRSQCVSHTLRACSSLSRATRASIWTKTRLPSTSKLMRDEARECLEDEMTDFEGECTDGEAVLSDEDAEDDIEEEDEHVETSLFPWNRVSFTQWWKDRT